MRQLSFLSPKTAVCPHPALAFRVSGFGFRVSGLGFRASGRSLLSGLGFGVWGLGIRASRHSLATSAAVRGRRLGFGEI